MGSIAGGRPRCWLGASGMASCAGVAHRTSRLVSYTWQTADVHRVGRVKLSDSEIWAQIFKKWPATLPQRGVVVTAFNDQIPFCGFLRTEDALLLERQTPDAVGARKVILAYSQIVGLKITDPIGADVFREAGFSGQLPALSAGRCWILLARCFASDAGNYPVPPRQPVTTLLLSGEPSGQDIKTGGVTVMHRNEQRECALRAETRLPGASREAFARRVTDALGRMALVALNVGTLFLVQPLAAQTAVQPPATYAELPSEMPSKFEPTNDGFDFVKRNEMIPMRDGVKLHTVILIPKGATHAPILLTRTPYDANRLTSHSDSAHLGPVLQGYDNAVEVIVEGGYIRVVQDVRGKHGSEGDYVVNRPLRGPQNPTPVDHSTDTWDTIDWLVKHIPESNGKVGILGISYNGFLPLMALVDPHPGAQGLGADEPDGGRLDRRRLVSLRRVSSIGDVLDLRSRCNS